VKEAGLSVRQIARNLNVARSSVPEYQTSNHLRKKFEWLGKVYWKDNIVWSPGYFVATVGIDEDKILKYVEWKGRQDSGQAKLEF
jgi:REP element-mobilizing transposase RayT